ncbi:hypothetical protein [Maritalea sp.]|uniref:hypothetical protein n=1 Tax=Maritalea sp. TaxID=2003361 RepID=UPI003EFA97F9
MFRNILAAVALSSVVFPSFSHADSSEDLIEYVSQLPRDSALGLPMYWMEMGTAVGWDQMMLVFGYASANVPAIGWVLSQTCFAWVVRWINWAFSCLCLLACSTGSGAPSTAS